MTISISIDPQDPHGSDHSLSDGQDSVVGQDIMPSEHEDYDNYDDSDDNDDNDDNDGWAYLAHSDKLKATDLGPRARKSTRTIYIPTRSSRLWRDENEDDDRLPPAQQKSTREFSTDQAKKSSKAKAETGSFTDEWAHLSYPDDLKPSGSVSRPTRRTRSPKRPSWRNVDEDYYRMPPPPSPAQKVAQGKSSKDRAKTLGEEKARLQSPDWLLRSGDLSKDITIHFDLDAGLDISQDLGSLSRLNRLGHFKEAAKLFEERLASHLDFFPVVAEYADLLLEQGSFGHLARFLSGQLDDSPVQYSEDEIRLLKLLKSLAEIYTRGALIPALEMAIETIKTYASESAGNSTWSDLSIGLQIQLVETCLRIRTYAFCHSSFLFSASFRPLLGWKLQEPHDRDQQSSTPRHALANLSSSGPNSSSNEDALNTRHLPAFGVWYRFLVQQGFLWESHRVLRLLLKLHGDIRGQYTPIGGFDDLAKLGGDLSKVMAVFLSPAGVPEDDEQLLLTDLANATLLTEFFNVESSSKEVLAVHKQFSEKAHSLATMLLLKHPHLVNCRPYLNWTLLKAREKRWIADQSPLSEHDSILFSRIRFQDSTISPFKGLQAFGQQRAEDLSTQTQPRRTKASEASTNFLKVIFSTAQELGDYLMQQSTFQSSLQASCSINDRLQLIHDFATLNSTVMEDTVGYLQCLLEEYLLLEILDTKHADELRMDLHNRLSKFDASFPCRFEHHPDVRKALESAFFDIPSLAWMRSNVWNALMKRLGWDFKTDPWTMRLNHIQEHLPTHLVSLLYSTSTPQICTGCPDCGGQDQSPEEERLVRVEKDNSRALRPSYSRGSYLSKSYPGPPYPGSYYPGSSDMAPHGSRPVPLTIADHSYLSSAGTYHDVGHLEKHIQQLQGERYANPAGEPTPRPFPAPPPVDTAKDEAIARLEKMIMDDRAERKAAALAKIERLDAEKKEAEYAAKKKAVEMAKAEAAAAAAAAAVAQENETRDIQWLIDQVELLKSENKLALRRGATAPKKEAGLSQAQDLVTMKDPMGREFKLSLHECHTFAEMDEVIRQLLQDDALLSSHIANGDYEFLDPSGNIFSRLDSVHALLPGWTVAMRFTDDGNKNDQTADQVLADDTPLPSSSKKAFAESDDAAEIEPVGEEMAQEKGARDPSPSSHD